MLRLELRHDPSLTVQRCALLLLPFFIDSASRRRSRVDAVHAEAEAIIGELESLGPLLPHPAENRLDLCMTGLKLVLGGYQVQQGHNRLCLRCVGHEVAASLLGERGGDERRLLRLVIV